MYTSFNGGGQVQGVARGKIDKNINLIYTAFVTNLIGFGRENFNQRKAQALSKLARNGLIDCDKHL